MALLVLEEEIDTVSYYSFQVNYFFKKGEQIALVGGDLLGGRAISFLGDLRVK
jgi:hypothetical protein